MMGMISPVNYRNVDQVDIIDLMQVGGNIDAVAGLGQIGLNA